MAEKWVKSRNAVRQIEKDEEFWDEWQNVRASLLMWFRGKPEGYSIPLVCYGPESEKSVCYWYKPRQKRDAPADESTGAEQE